MLSTTVFGQAVIKIDTGRALANSYLGNGVQWDPYEVKSLSDADWEKAYRRLDFMKLGFARVVINASLYCKTAPLGQAPVYDFNSPTAQVLYKILDYCQSRHVTVILGEWGDPSGKGETVDRTRKQLRFDGIQEYDPRWTFIIGDFLTYLINEKKYTCIKYYNLGNEPNGDWMYTESFATWKTSIINLDNELKARNLRGKVKIVGPDASWANQWIKQIIADKKLVNIIDAYEVHWYAMAKEINSESFEKELAYYRDYINTNDPNGKSKPFFLGEGGMLEGKSKTLDQQKMIGTFQYGVWMADYAVQSMQAGQAGVIAWSLDDAMHVAARTGNTGSLNDYEWKEWGLWDSFGEEKGKPELEKLRPWYYTWSLLSKYVPAGSKILKVDSTGIVGLRSAAVTFNDNGQTGYTFIIVNATDSHKEVNLQLPAGSKLTLHQFSYFENDMSRTPDGFPVEKRTIKNVSNSKILKIGLESKGVVVLTTMK
ncbi:hypothetical protein [Mucilaginibacter sp. dw_454]|uniref:hypothetical protein n=1 Tax=Mucilaginibacter sp. dw_454 TaxID=2720079 RepID=UPI001BD4CC4B|nr:hypothetical protein [Mucilaginibacter sp. dw_454]